MGSKRNGMAKNISCQDGATVQAALCDKASCDNRVASIEGDHPDLFVGQLSQFRSKQRSNVLGTSDHRGVFNERLPEANAELNRCGKTFGCVALDPVGDDVDHSNESCKATDFCQQSLSALSRCRAFLVEDDGRHEVFVGGLLHRPVDRCGVGWAARRLG